MSKSITKDKEHFEENFAELVKISDKAKELKWEERFDRKSIKMWDIGMTAQSAIKYFIRTEISRAVLQAEKQWCLKKPNIDVSTVIGFEAGVEEGRRQREEEIKGWAERDLAIMSCVCLDRIRLFLNKK